MFCTLEKARLEPRIGEKGRNVCFSQTSAGTRAGCLLSLCRDVGSVWESRHLQPLPAPGRAPAPFQAASASPRVGAEPLPEPLRRRTRLLLVS